jgi:competence protein ComEC
MLKNHPLVKVLLPFTIGIWFSDILSSSLAHTFLSDVLVAILLCLVLFISLFSKLKRIVSTCIYSSFFISGFLLLTLQNESLNPNHFSFIQSDYLEGTVETISKTSTSRFLKTTVSVNKSYAEWGVQESMGKLALYIDSTSNQLNNGDKILFSSSFQPITNSLNPGEFNSKQFWNNQGIFHQSFIDSNEFTITHNHTHQQSILSRIHTFINTTLNNHLSGDELSLAKGILLGDKSSIRAEIKNAFSGAGAMHLLAVSGLHVGIFLFIIQWFFKRFLTRLPKWVEFTLLLLILWMYAGVTGFSASVNRAVTMFTFLAYASVYGKNYSSLNGLFASALLLLIVRPSFLFDIGFQLSYLAMLGIFLFSSGIQRAFYIQNKLLKKTWAGTSVALAAQLGTFPLTIYYFHQFPNYFLLTNLGLMVFSGTILGLGLGLISFGWIPILNSIVAGFVFISITSLIYFIEWVNALPFALTKGIQLTTSEVLLFYSILILLYWSLTQAKKRYVKIGFVACALILSAEIIKWNWKYTEQEILILNASSPTLFIRNGKKGELVTLSNNPNALKKLDYQKKSLEDYYGITIQTNQFSLEKAKIEFENPNFETGIHKNILLFNADKTKTVYITGNHIDIHSLIDSENIIIGNWVSQTTIQHIKSVYPTKKMWILGEKGSYALM